MSATLRTVAAYSSAIAAVRGGHAPDDHERRAEAAARAALGFLSEPGDGVLGRLVAAAGAPAVLDLVVAGARPAEFAAALGASGEAGGILAEPTIAHGIRRWRPRIDATAFERSLEQAARVGARLLIPGDAEWPMGVDDLGANAPLALWVRGRPDALAGSQPAIALVGARAASGYGEHVAAEASSGLVDRGFLIVSGGAYGIDGTAHRAALASDGTTVAFLAGGIDRFYPTGHDALLTRIAQAGAIISEVSCGTAPSKWRFLQRNRLIAAAGAATVVIEAGLRSGSLNTAGHAAQLGRPLGAVPGPVTSPSSAGCHRLMREHNAMCVVDAAQMAELASGMGFGIGAAGSPSRPTTQPEPSPDAVRLLDALSPRSPRTVDDLARRSGMAPGLVMSTLAELEVDLLVARDVDGSWKSRARRR
ncbi:DNA-processing protein DprA [Agromyces lapidis]|uniref:DNA-processing protein DprA n=1 Tax=Agromyces lapidis TaxID=279574 RepID=A0ABV5SQ03_9MICO|nr:DNA-processing protein DprA [Agromyces lapidis]